MEKDYSNTPLWDNALSLDERLDYLIGELTLEEKIACMGTGNPDIPRLGIREFHVGGEAAHGVQARHDQSFDKGEPDFTTVFPNPIGMSATWDDDLLRQAGEVVSTEARGLFSREGKGSLSMWAPTVDMERDPRWGRTEEAYGEDPLLTGRMAGAYVEGLQGEDDFYLRTAATLKHFYANNVEEGRVWKSSSLDARNKWEYYLEPFRQIISEHGAEALMTSYNEINGIPAIINPDVQHILKKRWGLHHVVCDGGDMTQTVDFHHYYENHADTLAAGLLAGVDCFTEDIELVSMAVKTALEQHKITEEDLDRALRRHFGTLLRLGFFDASDDNPYADITMEQVGTPKHHAIARAVATEGIVLLQNHPILENSLVLQNQPTAGAKLLPLDETKKIAVMGPLADVVYKDWYAGLAPYSVKPLQGLFEALGKAAGQEELGQGGATLPFEAGLPHVYLRVGEESYLGLDDNCVLRQCDRQHAEVFELEGWDGTQMTIRSLATGKFLTVEDDFERGQQGFVTATKEEAFGWFVREVFHFMKGEDGAEGITEDGFSGQGILSAWNHACLRLDEQGRVCVEKSDEPAENVRDGETGSFTYSGLSICLEMVRDGIAEAQEIAAEADTVVLFLGANPVITCKEEVDRKDLRLPPYQSGLLKKVQAVNPNVVLVLVSSVPFGIDWAKEHIPAIVVSATGGMELGNALADVLVGRVSPAGRLPMTWYSVEEKLPDIDDYDIIRGERTYLYFQGKPLYPFGHGLTYGDIHYDALTVSTCTKNRTDKDKGVMCSESRTDKEASVICSKSRTDKDTSVMCPKMRTQTKKELAVSLCVTNKGEHATDEVVQIYGRKVHSARKRPRKQLLDFVRVKNLKPGESREIFLCIPEERLYYYDVILEERLLEDGEYEILAGSSCEALPLRAAIYLEGQKPACRKQGRGFAAENFDTCENAVLVEGDSKGDDAIWIPAGGHSFVRPAQGETMQLVYESVEIPEKEALFLEMLVREEGEWSGSVRLGELWQAEIGSSVRLDKIGNSVSQDDVRQAEIKAVCPEEKDEAGAKQAMSCRHPDGRGWTKQSHLVPLESFGQRSQQKDCAGGTQECDGSGGNGLTRSGETKGVSLARLVIEATGEVAFGKLKLM